MNKYTERIYNGVVKENPTFVMMLGMCPTLAVTTSAFNGAGMGLTTTVVLIFSNLIISLMRKIIPDRVRIPAFIVIVASLVTIVQLLLQGFIPSLYDQLGIYIPLIVVNCIILGRAEAYASSHPPIESACDGIGMGLGFTIALTAIGAFREFLGTGAIFNFSILPESAEMPTIFVMAPGAFFVLAMLTALQNKFKAPSATNGVVPAASQLSCGGNCAACNGIKCAENHIALAEAKAKIEEEKRIAMEEAKKKAMEAAKLKAAKAAAEKAATQKKEGEQ
ncbi:MAG: electron transport complex subunit RsxE [Lachnospiraceae bacterium]